MEIIIRSAILEDLPILYDFEQGIIDYERPFDETLKTGKINYYDLEAMIGSKKTEVAVAVVNREIVGSGYVKIKKGKSYLQHDIYGYLGFMFVKPDFRGLGINRQIISHLKDWARSINISELRLDAYDENLSAVKAYEKAGFRKQLVNMRMKLE